MAVTRAHIIGSVSIVAVSSTIPARKASRSAGLIAAMSVSSVSKVALPPHQAQNFEQPALFTAIWTPNHPIPRPRRISSAIGPATQNIR